MREIIDYSNNFKSGETIERKRNKEDVAYRGIATIQVFDERGAVIQEVKSENCINRRWLSYIYKTFFRSSLFYSITNGLITNTARWMVLTSNTEEENIEYPLIKGNMIGYADGRVTYSGDDKFKGTLNTAETVKNLWNCHYVIDFPTHAANGTFQSIYWVPYSSTEPDVCLFKDEDCLITLDGTDWMYSNKVCGGKGYGFSAYRDKFYRINLKQNKIDVFNNLTFAIDGDVRSADFKEDKIYFFYKDYMKIYNIDYDFLEQVTYKFGILNYIYSTAAYEDGFIMNVGNNKYYLLDNEMNKIREIEPLVGVSKCVYLGDNMFMFCGEYSNNFNAQLYNVVTNQFVSWVINVKASPIFGENVGAYEYYNVGPGFVNGSYNIEEKCIYFANNNKEKYSLHRASIVPWFAHTLLPAPVTKTATNTMKIQYDFIVEERGFFD